MNIQISGTTENNLKFASKQDYQQALSKMIISKNNNESIPKYLQNLVNNKKSQQQLSSQQSKEKGNFQQMQIEEKNNCQYEGKKRAKENIQPIITESMKQSLQNVSAKLFFNSPTSKQFAVNAKLFQQIAQKQLEKESDENNSNENNNNNNNQQNLPRNKKEKKSCSNINRKGQQQIKQQAYNENGLEQQFIQPLPGIQSQQNHQKKASNTQYQNSLFAQSPKVLNRPSSTNFNKNNKNVATISLDTNDFFKLKKRLNVKNSSKILSRNHSNEQSIKTNNSQMTKDKSIKFSEAQKKAPLKRTSKSRKQYSQNRNDSYLKLPPDQQQQQQQLKQDQYNLSIEITKNLTTFAKQYFENMEKNSKDKPKKGKRQLTQHDLKNLADEENQRVNQRNEENNINNTNKQAHSRKLSSNSRQKSKKNNSLQKKNEYQFSINNTQNNFNENQQVLRNQSKNYLKITRNSNLKLNNFANNEKESDKITVKTMSHKNLSQNASKQENGQNKILNFNLQKQNKEKDNLQQENKKRDCKNSKVDTKLLSIKTNIALGSNLDQVTNAYKPKTTKADNYQFNYLNNKNKKKEQNACARQSYDNGQLVNILKQQNEEINQQQQQQNDIQIQNKKRESSKNSKKQKSGQGRHVRNFTSDLNTQSNAINKVKINFLNQSQIQQKSQQSNLQSMVTQVKQGQQFLNPSSAEYTVTQLPSTAISPKMPIIDTKEFQELYYLPKMLDSFILESDDYFLQLFREHLMQTIQTVHFTSFIKQINKQVIKSKQIKLERKVKFKKTIIFDLDETLIHCNESINIPSDVVLPIEFPTGEQIQAGINIRPYAKECLQMLSQYYEIIVFTASHSCYANVVLDYLDPDCKYISHRLFRDNCIQTDEGIYVKDLRIFKNRNLDNVLIVDNAAYSFAFHLNNGIPIIPYYDNQNDNELKDLTNYLIQLEKYNNIVQINANVFKFIEYNKYNNPIELLESLYSQLIENK